MITDNVIKVGIADIKIARSQGQLRTSGLGSCVGVVIYDRTTKIAGMVHVMLPDSSISQKGNLNPLKYADTAIEILIQQLLDNGARKNSLKAKIAGGAQMFSFNSNSGMLKVGARNIEAVKQRLHFFKIPIIASDVGGNNGRTIEFSIENGSLKVRTVNLGTIEI